MIKRKYKKKTRRNPHVDDIYLTFIANALYKGIPQDLVRSMIYFIQGKLCKDCNKNARFCECDYCNECGFNKCLCDLGFTINSFYTDVDNIHQIRHATGRLARETLNQNQINTIKKWIENFAQDDELSSYEYKILKSEIDEVLDE